MTLGLPGSRVRLVPDAIVVLVAGVLSLDTLPMLRPLHGATPLVLFGTALALIARRRAPLAVAWLVVATGAVLPVVELVAAGTLLRSAQSVNSVLLFPPCAPFAAYVAFAHARQRIHPWLPVSALALLAVAVGLLLPAATPHFGEPAPYSGSVALGFRSFAFVATGALLGLFVKARRRLLQSLRERAVRAERERHLLAEQARAEEQARLAAEIHDVVAHRLSRMVVQAGALRMTAPDEATRAAFDELRAVACQALEEMGDVVGLLRGDPGEAVEEDLSTAGPLPDLSPLIEESELVGIAVEIVEEGQPAPATAVVNRTAYRIVQEALTNVRKHAPGARVSLHIGYQPGGVRLTVRNTPATQPVDAMLVAASSGAGLLGLRQRVELVNGSLAAGPEPDGGFQVQALLPTVRQAAPDTISAVRPPGAADRDSLSWAKLSRIDLEPAE